MSRFAWAESHGLISAADFAAVTDTAGSFTPATVIYDTSQGGTMNGSGDRRVLGPFETASEALLALRPADRSFLAPESRLGLLKETLHAAGVELGEWDWTVARWLAELDVQTIASIIGWVGRSGGDYDDSPGLEPYCAECGAWIGMFLGLDGWQHFMGDLGPGGQRELFDAGHAASPSWCQPPGRTISPADAVTIRRALAEAEGSRRDRARMAGAPTAKATPPGRARCTWTTLDQADAFRDLGRRALGTAGSSVGEPR